MTSICSNYRIHVLIHVVNLIDLKPQSNQFENLLGTQCVHFLWIGCVCVWWKQRTYKHKKCIDSVGFIANSKILIGKLNVTSDSRNDCGSNISRNGETIPNPKAHQKIKFAISENIILFRKFWSLVFFGFDREPSKYSKLWRSWSMVETMDETINENHFGNKWMHGPQNVLSSRFIYPMWSMNGWATRSCI